MAKALRNFLRSDKQQSDKDISDKKNKGSLFPDFYLFQLAGRRKFVRRRTGLDHDVIPGAARRKNRQCGGRSGFNPRRSRRKSHAIRLFFIDRVRPQVSLGFCRVGADALKRNTPI